ncbi:MAG: hypothetical protein ACRDPM_01225 [Solirubrobacteraceae bacterium]
MSRRAHTPPRARRFDVLLCDRAMAARPQILEIAAALERAAEPSAGTLAALRRLLRDGCASPLYDRAIPEQRLWDVLNQVRLELQASETRAPADQRGTSDTNDPRVHRIGPHVSERPAEARGM